MYRYLNDCSGSRLPDYSWDNIPNGENIPNNPPKLPNGHKLFQKRIKMAVKYTNIFHSKALQNIPK
jgi:hypothetical protein